MVFNLRNVPAWSAIFLLSLLAFILFYGEFIGFIAHAVAAFAFGVLVANMWFWYKNRK